MSPSLGSRRWRRTRASVLTLSSPYCGHCGHWIAVPELADVDHALARANGGAVHDPGNLRLAHGSRARCYECPGYEQTGRACNQVEGGRVGAQRKAETNPSAGKPRRRGRGWRPRPHTVIDLEW